MTAIYIIYIIFGKKGTSMKNNRLPPLVIPCARSPCPAGPRASGYGALPTSNTDILR